MKQIVFPLSCLAVVTMLAMAGCKSQKSTTGQSDSPTHAPAATPAAPAATTATAPYQQTTDAAEAGTSFDRAAFAGTFIGTLPCADCPGIDETLQLDADGNFELTDVYRARPDSTNIVRGTWSTEADGAHLRLDPEKKSDVDRVFEIDGNNILAPLGMDGERIDSPFDLTLKRSDP